LDKLEQNKPESEDEICAHTNSVETDDSDDEWNSVSAKYYLEHFQKKNLVQFENFNLTYLTFCYTKGLYLQHHNQIVLKIG